MQQFLQPTLNKGVKCDAGVRKNKGALMHRILSGSAFSHFSISKFITNRLLKGQPNDCQRVSKVRQRTAMMFGNSVHKCDKSGNEE